MNLPPIGSPNSQQSDMYNDAGLQKPLADDVASLLSDRQAALRSRVQNKQRLLARLMKEQAAKEAAAVTEADLAFLGTYRFETYRKRTPAEQEKAYMDNRFYAWTDTIKADYEAAWKTLCPPDSDEHPEVAVLSIAKKLNDTYRGLPGWVSIPTDADAMVESLDERQTETVEQQAASVQTAPVERQAEPIERPTKPIKRKAEQVDRKTKRDDRKGRAG